jgi:chromosome segregation ATPase
MMHLDNPPPRLTAIAELFGLIQLLQRPDGLEKIAGELRALHEQAVEALANVQAAQSGLAAERGEHEAAVKAQNERAEALRRREVDLASAQSALATGQAQLQADRGALDARQSAVEKRDHDVAAAEGRAAARKADLDAREAAITAREADLAQLEAHLKARADRAAKLARALTE